MAEPDKNETLNEDEEETEKSYIPASFEKRTAAWMGIAYTLMILFVITATIFRSGEPMTGTFPLFLVPIAVAAIVISIYRQHQGTAPGGMALTVIIVVLCTAAIVLALFLGVPALIAAFSV